VDSQEELTGFIGDTKLVLSNKKGQYSPIETARKSDQGLSRAPSEVGAKRFGFGND